MSEELDKAVVNDAIQKLSEHFDTVQVFTTRYEPNNEGNTIGLQMGQGNWYARFGHIKEWVSKQDEYVRVAIRNEDRD